MFDFMKAFMSDIDLAAESKPDPPPPVVVPEIGERVVPPQLNIIKMSPKGEMTIDFSDDIVIPSSWTRKFERDQKLNAAMNNQTSSKRRMKGAPGGNWVAFNVLDSGDGKSSSVSD